jgi:hypothetical protein
MSLAESTGLPPFYHELKDKQKQLTKFLGSSQAIITIIALSNGVNLPNLRVVLHLPGATFGLKDFGQESGRLSRNNEAGVSIVCVSGISSWFLPKNSSRSICPHDQGARASCNGPVCADNSISSANPQPTFRQLDLSCSNRAVAKCDNTWFQCIIAGGTFQA